MLRAFPSTKTALFMDGTCFWGLPSTFLAVFTDGKMSHCYDDFPVCIRVRILEIKTEHI